MCYSGSVVILELLTITYSMRPVLFQKLLMKHRAQQRGKEKEQNREDCPPPPPPKKNSSRNRVA